MPNLAGGGERLHLREDPPLQVATWRDGAVGVLRQRLQLRRRYVASNHEDRVLGPIPFAIPAERVFARQCSDLVLWTDHRDRVGMPGIKSRPHHLVQHCRRLAVHALPTLAEHDVPFRRDLVLGKLQVHHAISFHPHHLRQPVLRDTEMVVREIV